MNVHMHLILLVPAILSARCVAGASCQDAVFTDPSENGGSVDLDCLEDADQTLHLIQRRAKAKEEAIEAAETTLPPPLPDQREDGATRRGLLPLAARLDLALGGLLGLVQWSPALNVPEPLHGAAPMHQSAKRSLAQTWASRLLEASSLRETMQSWLQDLRQVPARLRQDRNSGWAAVLIASWGILFCSLVCFFLHSALCARASRQEQDPDTRVSCKVEEARLDANVFLEKAQRVSWWQCFTFTWMDQFLGGDFDLFTTKGPHTGALKQAWEAEVRQQGVLKASFWRALFKAVSRRSMILLMACAWLSAFLEFIGMVLALDVILFILEHEAKRETSLDALQTTSAVLVLLFVVPLAYRFLSAAVCVLDGHLATVISADITALLYEKSLRLPAGCMYHSHVSGEGNGNASQLAATMAASAAQEWPQMLKTLSLLSAAPVVAAALVALLLWHMGFPGLLGCAYVLPGSCIAILVVKWAISWRHEYQLCQSLRLRWLRALTSSRRQRSLGFHDALCRKISAAREQELAANENYSVVAGLLIANLHSVVWLVVVGSLFSSVLLGYGSPARNVWVVLQIVASLQACSSLVVSGLRRALTLPSSLQRLECFLKQPEMPIDVVRPPALHGGAPVVHVAGHFSFEEGGPLVLRDMDFSVQRGERVALVGRSGSGKTALLQTIIGELFPCGLSFVSATHLRSYWSQEPWIPGAALASIPSVEKGLGRGWENSAPGDLTARQRARLMLSSQPGAEDPEVILLDDALSLLDPEEAQEMLDACISRPRAKRAALVVAMANASLRCLKHFDRIVLLGGGRVLAQGPPQEILNTKELAEVLTVAPSSALPAPEQPSPAHWGVRSHEDPPEASPEPLGVLHQALLRQPLETCRVDLRDCPGRVLDQGEGLGELGRIVVSWLQAAGYGQLFLAVVLVLLQRCAQLAQLLVLARWGDMAMSSGNCDHKGFAIGVLVALASNAVLLVASEWVCSRVAREASARLHQRLLVAFRQSPFASSRTWREAFAGDLAHVDSVVLSSFLSGLRSSVGTLLQQAYILSIAPQWLACVVLLPLYACICYFCWVHLWASGQAARSGRLFLAEAQDIMEETLVDPVSVRANLLGARVAARVSAAAKASAAFVNVFPAASRAWVCFRVALCLSFAASACALHVLLCDEARHVGVGSLGLIVSLFFAFLGDCEAAAEVGGQAAVALSALGRIFRLTRGMVEPKSSWGALETEIEISSQDLHPDLVVLSDSLGDASGPLLSLRGWHLAVAKGRNFGELATALARWQDYCIVYINNAAFDAQDMADVLLTAKHKASANSSPLVLGLRHSSIMTGLSVSFDNVSLALGGLGLTKAVPLNFTVPRGSHVAVVGPSGSGKSKLLAVAAGLHHCDGVCVEGRLAAEGLENFIGFVSQEPVVWEGTWRDNLDLEDRFTDEALWALLRGLGLDAIAAAKPQGLGTVLAADGGNLSLEQRYLLSLARVALRRPPLLLLDECPTVRSMLPQATDVEELSSEKRVSETGLIQSPTTSQTLRASLSAVLSEWFGQSTVLVAASSEAQAEKLGLTTMIRLIDGGMAC